MADCCPKEEKPVEETSCCGSKPAPEESSCCPPREKFDWILWGSLTFVAVGFAGYLLYPVELLGEGSLYHLFHTVYDLITTMWWGILLGILFVGLLDRVPREFVMLTLGQGTGLKPIFQATCAGVLLDLCNHGILMVAMKLYERGASAGQVIAFLVASPWNSFSMTLILWALIGLQWTILFILLSMIIGLVAGLLIERFIQKGVLPDNPNRAPVRNDFHFWREAKAGVLATRYDGHFFREVAVTGFREGKMILRWIFFGVMLATLIRVFVPTDIFQEWLGPSLVGLVMTLIATTLIEVCSEGSTPIAADILQRAGAPGNAFTFLMAGVATDYTEIMSMKETTSSWKIALFIPLLTVPQVLLVGYLLNQFA